MDVVTATDFRAFAQATRAGKYDMVVTAPNLGRMAQLDSRWLPVAQYEPGIPALLVASAQRDSPIAELRGKLTDQGQDGVSLAQVQSDLLVAQPLGMQQRIFAVLQDAVEVTKDPTTLHAGWTGCKLQVASSRKSENINALRWQAIKLSPPGGKKSSQFGDQANHPEPSPFSHTPSLPVEVLKILSSI